MNQNTDESIPILEAAKWLARMAAKDGVVSANERKLLKEFAEKYDLDYKYLYRLAHANSTDVEIPEVELISASKWKGRKFEEFIVSLCSDKSCFKLLSWRSDKTCGDTYPIDSLMPDLHIRYSSDDMEIEYFIECKFRSKLPDGILDLSNHIDRYRRMTESNKPHRLILALGIGGTPNNPDSLYIIPDESIPDDGIINIEDCKVFFCNITPESFRTYLIKTLC